MWVFSKISICRIQQLGVSWGQVCDNPLAIIMWGKYCLRITILCLQVIYYLLFILCSFCSLLNTLCIIDNNSERHNPPRWPKRLMKLSKVRWPKQNPNIDWILVWDDPNETLIQTNKPLNLRSRGRAIGWRKQWVEE